jgi:hypothetical protein
MYTKMLLALPFLKSLYQTTGNSLYKMMSQDARTFLDQGLTHYYSYYKPKPYGDDRWYRIDNDKVVADNVAYALRGVFEYEGLTDTVKTVYDSIQGYKSANYDTRFAWAGYIDVVHRTNGIYYYDVVTGGILAKIRKVHDPNSFNHFLKKFKGLQHLTFYWGLKFDYTLVPTNDYQQVITVAGIGWGILQSKRG